MTKKCSKCGLEDIEIKFKSARNICKKCTNIQDRLWRNKDIYCDILYKNYYIEPTIKKCTKCNEYLDLSKFKSGNVCDSCKKIYFQKIHKSRYVTTKSVKGEIIECRCCEVEKSIGEFSKHNRVCKKCKYNKWYKRQIDRKNSSTLFRFKCNLRSKLSTIFKKFGSKKLSTLEIVGCSFLDLKTHIELKFEPWMTWENRGKYNGELNYGWDIDHIIPISSAKTEDDVIKLNHYTNLQPLCSKINRDIKKDNYKYEN